MAKCTACNMNSFCFGNQIFFITLPRDTTSFMSRLIIISSIQPIQSVEGQVPTPLFFFFLKTKNSPALVLYYLFWWNIQALKKPLVCLHQGISITFGWYVTSIQVSYRTGPFVHHFATKMLYKQRHLIQHECSILSFPV